MTVHARNPLLTLASGDLSLVLAPKVGGAVAAFRHRTTDILRPTSAHALRKGIVRQFASFPLVPYSNRIAHGRFSMGGETHRLTPNFGRHPHAIHGNAWQQPWVVESAGASEAVLTLDHRPLGFGPAGQDGWPYRYHARQSVELTPSQVRFTLEIENRDERAMPAGLGWHPYFVRPQETMLAFRAGSVWRNGKDSLPRERVDVPAVWNFATLRPLGEPALDNCFAGWDGRAEIRFPDAGLSVRMEAAPECGHLVVYVPKGRDYFAVEPVTHMNDAVNRTDVVADHGLRILPPGERFATVFSLAVGAGG